MMIPNEERRTDSVVENEVIDDQSGLTPRGDYVHILNQMKPFLKSMERGGTLLDILLEAFKGDEHVLHEKLKPALPAKWMKAPDQKLMLNYNWNCPDATDRLLDFKDNKIYLGDSYEEKFNWKRRHRHICSTARNIESDDFRKSRDGLSYVIQGGGCSCCNGNKRTVFTLLYHPQKMQFKLLVQETITAFCTSSDNVEEPYDGYEYVAYIRKDDMNTQSEIDVDPDRT